MKPLTVNPIKTSPALGACYAVQGIKGAAAVFHAAPGCTFLGKVLLTQHLREPVCLLGTDIAEVPVIMGGYDALEKKVRDICSRLKPSILFIIGTALSEVRGEDISGMILSLKSRDKDLTLEMIYIPSPDYIGGFSDGYARTIEILLEKFSAKTEKTAGQINILPSPSVTLGDIEELKGIVKQFDLSPMVLPDLSSMDGSKDRYSILPEEGITIEEIKQMGGSEATIVIGKSMQKAGKIIQKICGVPSFFFDGLIGIRANDAFIKILKSLSKKEVPEDILRWRRRLIDGMVDTHLVLADKDIAVGLDGDLPSAIGALCSEMGMNSFNLEDLEEIRRDAAILISNSHGAELSQRQGIPLLRAGFPVFDKFGEPLKVRIGYRGSLNLIFEMANLMEIQAQKAKETQRGN